MTDRPETSEPKMPPRRTRRIVAAGAAVAALAGAGVAATGNGGEQEVVSAGQAANQEARSPQAAQVQRESQEVSAPQANATVQGETSSTVEVPASIAPAQRAAATETTVPTAANQAPKPEQQTSKEMSLQQQEAYGDELLRQSRAGAGPLAGVECGRILYRMKDGQEVPVNNAVFASKIPGDRPSASVPDDKKFFMHFVEKVGPDGKVTMNPDGTPEYRTEVFTPTRDEKLPHAALDTCLVRIEKLGDYGNRPVGEIISDNPSSNGLRIEIGSSHTGPNTVENQEGETLHVSLEPEQPPTP